MARPQCPPHFDASLANEAAKMTSVTDLRAKEKDHSKEWPPKQSFDDLSGAVNCLVMLTRDDNAGGKAS